MESEKVKEIKDKLHEEIFIANSFGDKLRRVETKDLQDILTLINELESENERLNSRHRNLKINYNKTWKQYREYEVENQQLKDRIAELENEKEQTMKMWLEDRKGMFWDGVGEGELKGYKQLKQFAERLKEKVKNFCGTEYENAYYDTTKSFACNDIDETLNEFLNK